MGELLADCKCKHGGGGCLGRVQWDPERDIWSPGFGGRESKAPRKMLRRRAVQIGLSRHLSKRYVASAISIQEVTDLAHRVEQAHRQKTRNDCLQAMHLLLSELPIERPYLPKLYSNRAPKPWSTATQHLRHWQAPLGNEKESRSTPIVV